jgi:hypothetical protein
MGAGMRRFPPQVNGILKVSLQSAGAMTAPSAAATAAPAPEALLPLQGVLASLSKFEPPFEIDRFGASFGLHPVRPSGVLEFRFCFK